MTGYDLDVLVMDALIRGPSYGYPIRKTIMGRSDGKVKPSLAVIYKSLSRLVDAGMLRVERKPSPEGPPRKYYRLTGKGVTAYNERRLIYRGLVPAKGGVADVSL